MAGNKKIFDLPLRTGITSDDRLAVVDSGNTATYSVKVSDLRDGTGVNSLESLTGDIIFSGTNIDITTSGQTIYLSGSTGGGGGVFVSGDGTNNVLPDYYPLSAITSGNTNTFLAGGDDTSNRITTGNSNRYLIGGQNNTLLGGINSGMIGGDGNTIASQGSNDVIIAGIGNDMSFDSYRRGMFAGRDNNLSQGWQGVIIGGRNNIKSNGDDNGIFAGNGNSVTGNRAVALGGQSNTASGNNAVVSGFANTASGEHSAVIGGGGNNRAEKLRSVVIGGESNRVSNGQGGVVVSGINNNVSHNRSVIVGGQGQTTLQDDEAVVYKLRMTQYASLDFADDTAAAAGGVQLGQFYHTSGVVKIRIV